MSTLLRYSAGAFAAAGLVVGASSSPAAVLYDNGAVNGTIGAFTIGGNGGYAAVSDSFILNVASIITGIDFGVWTYPGDTVSTVDWGISSTLVPSGGFLASGTASVSVLSSAVSGAGWPISTDSIQTGSISLAAGTYYLVLQNAVASNGDPVYWDATNGLSQAWSSVYSYLVNSFGQGTSGSESFEVEGSSSSSTPEPGSWALMLLGFGGLGLALRGARPPAPVTRRSKARTR
jgi:hypothetical protein